jgi:hypothetical protein
MSWNIINHFAIPFAQNIGHLANWQAMFPWPTLALGTHSRFRGNGLLGYSQTLTDAL